MSLCSREGEVQQFSLSELPGRIGLLSSITLSTNVRYFGSTFYLNIYLNTKLFVLLISFKLKLVILDVPFCMLFQFL